MSEKPEPNEWELRHDIEDPVADAEWKIHEHLKKLTGPLQPIKREIEEGRKEVQKVVGE